jgi:hypothetical protein
MKIKIMNNIFKKNEWNKFQYIKLKNLSLMLILFISCSMSTRYTFDNIKTIKREPNQKLQVFVGTLTQNGSILNKGVDIFEFKTINDRPNRPTSDLDIKGMAVNLENEKILSNSSPMLNYLSYFTFCLLPCDYTTAYEVDVNYITYTSEKDFSTGWLQTKVKTEKIYLSEKIKYSIYQRGYFSEGFNQSNRKGFFDQSLSDSKYINDIRPFLIHLENNYKSIVETVNKEQKETLEKEKVNFEKEKVNFASVDKKNCKALYDFSVSDGNKELDTAVGDATKKCINTKVIKILSQKYPFAKSHLAKKVFLLHGTDLEMSFSDLWNAIILGKNSTTGFKISHEDFMLTQKGKEKMGLKVTTPDGSSMTFIFQPNAKNIIITNVESPEYIENWEDAIEPVLKKFAEWPTEENLDWKYLNSE